MTNLFSKAEAYQNKIDMAVKPDGRQFYDFGKMSDAAEYQAAIDDSVRPIEQTRNELRETKIQAFKYLLCTASAGLIELISNTILINVLPRFIDPSREMEFIVKNNTYVFIATTVALILSILWNFTLNRKFTFKSAANVPRAMFLAFLFYVPFYPFKIWFNGVLPVQAVAGTAAATGVSASVYLAEHTLILTGFEVVSMLINGVLEFCWQKFFIYRNDTNTAEK